MYTRSACVYSSCVSGKSEKKQASVSDIKRRIKKKMLVYVPGVLHTYLITVKKSKNEILNELQIRGKAFREDWCEVEPIC